MQDGLEAMVARIDERTEHMEVDIRDLKETCTGLSETVNKHSTELATIKAGIGNSNGLSKRQTAGIGGAAGFFIAAIVAVADYFMRH